MGHVVGCLILSLLSAEEGVDPFDRSPVVVGVIVAAVVVVMVIREAWASSSAKDSSLSICRKAICPWQMAD